MFLCRTGIGSKASGARTGWIVSQISSGLQRGILGRGAADVSGDSRSLGGLLPQMAKLQRDCRGKRVVDIVDLAISLFRFSFLFLPGERFALDDFFLFYSLWRLVHGPKIRFLDRLTTWTNRSIPLSTMDVMRDFYLANFFIFPTVPC